MSKVPWETYRLYFNALAPQWDTMPVDEERLAALLDRIPLPVDGRVLDIGCGTGRALRHIRRRIGCAGPLVALDLAEDMVAAARVKHSDESHLHFVVSCAELLPIVSGSCDTVVCLAALPHFREAETFFVECARILRPGGHLAVIHLMSSRELAMLHSRIEGPVSEDILPTREQLTSHLRASGLEMDTYVDEPGTYLLIVRCP